MLWGVSYVAVVALIAIMWTSSVAHVKSSNPSMISEELLPPLDRKEAAEICFKIFDFNKDEVLQPHELALAYAFNSQGQLSPLEVTEEHLEAFLTSLRKVLPSTVSLNPSLLSMPKEVFVYMFVEGNLKDLSDKKFAEFMATFAKYAKEEIPKFLESLAKSKRQ